ncbi:hypothetical protein [Streptomyces sp. NPDC059080]|uniref:hypothetical protein n=1 Tax=Streptomyces sp. NPDC059080 TaxID=3346718 RepID=UPI003686A9DB
MRVGFSGIPPHTVMREAGSVTTFLTPIAGGPAPGSDASEAELTTFLWPMIREDFLTEGG